MNGVKERNAVLIQVEVVSKQPRAQAAFVLSGLFRRALLTLYGPDLISIPFNATRSPLINPKQCEGCTSGARTHESCETGERGADADAKRREALHLNAITSERYNVAARGYYIVARGFRRQRISH